MNQIKDNINNYIRVGLSKYAIMSSINKVICTVILVFNFIGGALYYLFAKQICNKVVLKNHNNYKYIISDVTSKNMIILFIGFCLIEVLLVYVKIFMMFYGKEYFKDGRFGKVYNINPKRYNERTPYLSMAKNNLRMSKGNSLLTVVALVIIICAYITSIYYVKIIDRASVNYDDVKYILKLPDDYALDEEQIKDKTELINNMLEDERFGAYVRNVYYTKSYIDKKRISDKCKDYLRLYYEYNAILGNKLIDELPISIAVMSYEQLREEMDIELENNQGIFYSTPTCYSIENGIDISKGDSIFIYSSEYEKKQIEIVKVEAGMDINIYSDSMNWILVVNNETFDMLSSGITPNRIYISKEISETFLIDYLANINFVQLERLDFDNQTINISPTETEILLFFILVVCTSILFISLMVSCNTRIKVFANEYKTLFLIGIPESCVMRVPLYEMCIVLLGIICGSLVGSFIFTRIAYQLSTAKIIYGFPISEWINTMIIVVFFVLVCLIYNVREVIEIKKK